MENILSQLYNIFNFDPDLFLFLAPLLAGEVGVLFVSFLASSMAISFGTVWGLSMLALTVTDVFWFLVPRINSLQRLVKNLGNEQRAQLVKSKVDRLAKGRTFLMIILSKFLIGIRIPFMILLGVTSLSTARFIGMTIIINSFWAGLLASVGFIVQRSFGYVLNTLENVQLAVVILLVLIVTLYASYKYLKHNLIKD